MESSKTRRALTIVGFEGRGHSVAVLEPPWSILLRFTIFNYSDDKYYSRVMKLGEDKFAKRRLQKYSKLQKFHCPRLTV